MPHTPSTFINKCDVTREIWLMKEQSAFSYISLFHVYIHRLCRKREKCFLQMLVLCDKKNRLDQTQCRMHSVWSEPVIFVPPEVRFSQMTSHLFLVKKYINYITLQTLQTKFGQLTVSDQSKLLSDLGYVTRKRFLLRPGIEPGSPGSQSSTLPTLL